ncbi:MAG TPA: hypothetical protein VEJ63_11215 [Planctomycetota bacterium]|nr:hypothetical protein [Planctomycetota bacterium]
MSDLQKNFPIEKVPEARLLKIAERARHTAGKTQNRRRIGILDIAALIAATILGFLAWAKYSEPTVAKKPDALPQVAQPDTLRGRTTPPTERVAADEKEPAPAPKPPREKTALEKRRESIGRALAWLAAQQEPDGSYDGAKLGAKNCTTAATALATLAFLNAGHTHYRGAFKDNVKRGVNWLLAQQHENGKLLRKGDADTGYATAIATLAVTTAAEHVGDKDALIRVGAQKAVDYCANVHQAANGGFGYTPGPHGHTSPMGWFGSALYQAKTAGLEVRPQAFDKMQEYLEKHAKCKTGPGYAYAPNGAMSPACTAIAHLLRHKAGDAPADLKDEVTAWLERCGYPTWKDKYEVYRWYFAGPAVLAQGGDVAAKWIAKLDEALLTSQDMEGDDTGSWPNSAEYIGMLGRVGPTAMAAMCLTLTYQFESKDTAPIDPPTAPVQPSVPSKTLDF